MTNKMILQGDKGARNDQRMLFFKCSSRLYETQNQQNISKVLNDILDLFFFQKERIESVDLVLLPLRIARMYNNIVFECISYLFPSTLACKFGMSSLKKETKNTNNDELRKTKEGRNLSIRVSPSHHQDDDVLFSRVTSMCLESLLYPCRIHRSMSTSHYISNNVLSSKAFSVCLESLLYTPKLYRTMLSSHRKGDNVLLSQLGSCLGAQNDSYNFYPFKIDVSRYTFLFKSVMLPATDVPIAALS